jgi:hypothetical protein
MSFFSERRNKNRKNWQKSERKEKNNMNFSFFSGAKSIGY